MIIKFDLFWTFNDYCKYLNILGGSTDGIIIPTIGMLV